MQIATAGVPARSDDETLHTRAHSPARSGSAGSPILHYFRTVHETSVVALPRRLDDLVAGWAELRRAMARAMPAAFTRDEWAYLMYFLDQERLTFPFVQAFGQPVTTPDAPPARLLRPRGPVAVWLPKNVNVLGPLLLVLLSLTGNAVHFKASSQGDDLTRAFLDFALEHGGDGPLREYLRDGLRVESFDRHDPRNLEMAAQASVRIVFGSDDAAAAVESWPHPIDSIGFSFADRRSEVWLQPDALSDATLVQLLRVFAVYGQAGCTSPARVVLLDASDGEARELRDRLVALWPAAVMRRPAMHAASSNLMGAQWAATLGWDAVLAPDNAAVLAAGSMDLPAFAVPLALPIVAATSADAVAHLPAKIQTIGHNVEPSDYARWVALLARTSVKRFVPLAHMHHFGPTWDGWTFWRQTFEDVELGW